MKWLKFKTTKKITNEIFYTDYQILKISFYRMNIIILNYNEPKSSLKFYFQQKLKLVLLLQHKKFSVELSSSTNQEETTKNDTEHHHKQSNPSRWFDTSQKIIIFQETAKHSQTKNGWE